MLTLGIGTLIARWGFWILLGYGLWSGEVTAKRLSVFIALWFVALTASSFAVASGQIFTACVAVLDIALVLFIFKGDVRIS